MARPLRIEYAGGLYHVTARGDRREDIYIDDDRQLFIDVLAHCVDRFNWLLHAHCLMSNHYHLLIETPDGNLSQGMRQLNGVYTQRFNRRHGLSGHLFQGRYKAILVQKQTFLMEVARYIVLNPVRAGMVSDTGDWPWSSYPATAGIVDNPSWLETDWILSAFASTRRAATAQYKDFVRAGIGQPPLWNNLTQQVFLGDERFVTHAQKHLSKNTHGDLREIPRQQRIGRAKPLTWYEANNRQRNQAIQSAYASGGYSMREIGDYEPVNNSV